MEDLRTMERNGVNKSLQDLNVLTPQIDEFLHIEYEPTPRFQREYIRNGITVGISTNLEELEIIRPLWEEMIKRESSCIPDIDYDKYVSVIRSEAGQTKPFVMYLKDNDVLLSMIIGKIILQPLDLKLGYMTLLRPKLKCLSIIYGGIVGKPDDLLCRMLIDELTVQLKVQRADVVLINYLRTDSIFYRMLRDFPCFLFHQAKNDKHWRMDISDTIDDFYSARSRGHRNNLRRIKSKFEQKFSGDIKFVNYSRVEEVDEFLAAAADISRKTYQHALKAGLVNDIRTKERLNADALKGRFRGHIVFANNKPCAFLLGLHYENIYYMVNMGYDPEFRAYNPGMNLFLNVIENLCIDPMVDTLDFYFGDAEYKSRYGTKSWNETNVCVYAPRFYPMCIKILQTVLTNINNALQFALNKFGCTGRIKRLWRNILIS